MIILDVIPLQSLKPSAFRSKEIEQNLSGDLVHINTYITAKMDEDQMYNIALNDVGGEQATEACALRSGLLHLFIHLSPSQLPTIPLPISALVLISVGLIG